MSPSSHRANRAAIRSKYRKPKRRRGGSTAWNVAIAVVVIVGVAGVMLARSSNDASAKPPLMADPATGRPGDHWHAYIGFDLCGEWLPDAPSFEARADNPGVGAGIHSHGDGLIHIHPFSRSEEGDNATVGKFMQYGGWDLSEDGWTLWAGPPSELGQRQWKAGDKCPSGDMKGKTTELVYTVNDKKRSGNPADYQPKDGDVIAVYLVPKGSDLPQPPNARTALGNITDLGGASVPPSSTATTAPTSSTP